MLYLLIFFAMVSSTKSSSNVTQFYKRFGCVYHDKNYGLDTKWKGLWPNDPVYAVNKTDKLVFESHTEFYQFHRHVDEIVSDELESMLYNNIDSFITMYDAMKDSTYTSFTKFFKDYVATYPLPSDDGIPALLRVYEKIVNMKLRVRDVFMIGSVDKDVSYSFVEKVTKSENLHPPSDFQHQWIVGIIPFTVVRFHAGKEFFEGFIIIDMGDPKTPTPVVWMKNERNTEIYKYFTYEATYTCYSKYIAVDTNNQVFLGVNGKNEPIYDSARMSIDLIYTERSLCSFVQTTEKGFLLKITRAMAKFTRKGTYKALMMVDLRLFTVKLFAHLDEDASNFYLIDLNDFTPDELQTGDGLQIIQDIQSSMYPEGPENAIVDRIQRLSEIVKDKNFINSVIKWHDIIYSSPYKKSRITNLKDKLKVRIIMN